MSSIRRFRFLGSSARRLPMGGCRPLPCPESPIKGIRILVAKQVCHLLDIYLRPSEVLARQFFPCFQKQLPETCAVIDNSPLQGPIAQPEFARYSRYLRAASGKQAFKNPFYLLTDRAVRRALFKRAF